MVQSSSVWTQKLNTVRFLIPVMDDGSQLVHFLFSPMYNSSGRIKTANVPPCAGTTALLRNCNSGVYLLEETVNIVLISTSTNN